jgi:hypothetical protein
MDKKEKSAMYRAKNAEKIKEYRTINAEKIKEQQHSNKITCTCGSILLRKSYAGHMKFSHDIFMTRRNLA